MFLEMSQIKPALYQSGYIEEETCTSYDKLPEAEQMKNLQWHHHY